MSFEFFIYFWLCWVLVAARGVVARGGCSSCGARTWRPGGPSPLLTEHRL